MGRGPVDSGHPVSESVTGPPVLRNAVRTPLMSTSSLVTLPEPGPGGLFAQYHRYLQRPASDAADDNFNSYDPYPFRSVNGTYAAAVDTSVRRRGRRSRLLRRGRRLAASGRADAALGDAGGYQRHGQRVHLEPGLQRPPRLRCDLGPRRVLQLFPAAGSHRA